MVRFDLVRLGSGTLRPTFTPDNQMLHYYIETTLCVTGDVCLVNGHLTHKSAQTHLHLSHLTYFTTDLH